jgi:hypothetical protein
MHDGAHLAVLSLDPRWICLHLASGPGRLLPEGHSPRRLTVSSQDPSGQLGRQESRPGRIQPPCCHVLCVCTLPCSILRRIPKHAHLFYSCTALLLLCTSSVAVVVRWLAVLHVCGLGSAAVPPDVVPWGSVSLSRLYNRNVGACSAKWPNSASCREISGAQQLLREAARHIVLCVCCGAW